MPSFMCRMRYFNPVWPVGEEVKYCMAMLTLHTLATVSCRLPFIFDDHDSDLIYKGVLLATGMMEEPQAVIGVPELPLGAMTSHRRMLVREAIPLVL